MNGHAPGVAKSEFGLKSDDSGDMQKVPHMGLVGLLYVQ
jgi:hypothetical protein